MSIRSAVYSVTAVLLFGRLAKRAVYAAALLLALPLDVSAVANRSADEPPAAQFCVRNPHTCQSAAELYQEVQLRSRAVRALVATTSL